MGLIPSKNWAVFGRLAWEALSISDRALCLVYLVLPAINQLAVLGSFGFAVRAIRASSEGGMTEGSRIMLSALLLLVFSIAGFIRWLTSRIHIRLQ